MVSAGIFMVSHYTVQQNKDCLHVPIYKYIDLFLFMETEDFLQETVSQIVIGK